MTPHQYPSTRFEAKTQGLPSRQGRAICPRVERDRPRCQLCSLPPPPPHVMNIITLGAPACLLWMALVIYRGEPWAIGHPSFAIVLVAVCVRLRPLHLCLAFCLFFVKVQVIAKRKNEHREELDACKDYKLGVCTKALGQTAHEGSICKKQSSKKQFLFHSKNKRLQQPDESAGT